MTFAKGETPPVNGFWSITMYEIDNGWWFVPNKLNKFTVSPRNKLKYNADGSLTLYFQHESPGKNKEANWLPAPTGEFIPMLRMYWPKENTPSILNGTWKLPPLMRVGAPGVSASATRGNKKPVAEWTCAEFLAVEDQFRPERVAEAIAYSNTGKPEASAVSVSGIDTVTPMIVGECIKTQQAPFLDKVKAASGK